MCVTVHKPIDIKIAEIDLVNSLKDKCPTAFDYLYTAYAPSLYGFILKKIRCAATSEDLLQIIFVKAWTHIDQFNSSKGRLFTWMLQIARNSYIDYLRSPQQRLSFFSPLTAMEYLQDSRTLDKHLARFDIHQLLKLLPVMDRAILGLVLQGLTCREIGQFYQLPEGTVKTRIRTSYRKLRLAFV